MKIPEFPPGSKAPFKGAAQTYREAGLCNIGLVPVKWRLPSVKV
jgi:hypothetical protein